MIERSVQDVRAAIGANLAGVDHFAIAVADLESAVGFYRDVLGFEDVKRVETRGGRSSMSSAVMQQGATTIVLNHGIEPDSPISKFVREFGQGVHHVALRVHNLHLVTEGLKKLGVESEIDPIEGDGIRQIFLKREGPAGVRIELIERRGGDFSDESVEQMYRQLEERDIY